jgi:hypothetical protein
MSERLILKDNRLGQRRGLLCRAVNLGKEVSQSTRAREQFVG